MLFPHGHDELVHGFTWIIPADLPSLNPSAGDQRLPQTDELKVMGLTFCETPDEAGPGWSVEGDETGEGGEQSEQGWTVIDPGLPPNDEPAMIERKIPNWTSQSILIFRAWHEPKHTCHTSGQHNNLTGQPVGVVSDSP